MPYPRRLQAAVFDADCDWTGAVENRDVAGHFAEYDDPGRRDLPAGLVKDEVIGTPQGESSGCKAALPRNFRQGRRQVSRLLLPQVITDVDRDRQHLDQRASCCVIGQIGRDISPFGGDQNTSWAIVVPSSAGVRDRQQSKLGFACGVSLQVLQGGTSERHRCRFPSRPVAVRCGVSVIAIVQPPSPDGEPNRWALREGYHGQVEHLNSLRRRGAG